jgi:hypothetical protein
LNDRGSSSESIIASREVLLGDSQDVKAEAAKHPQMFGGPIYFPPKESSSVSVEQVPRPCGTRIRQTFTTRVLQEFDARTLEEICDQQSSDVEVYCITHYLPSYKRVFLELQYRYVPHSRVDIHVRVKRRNESARSGDGQLELGRAELLRLDGLAQELLVAARCD